MPIEVELDDRTHLAVGCGEAVELLAYRQQVTEVHPALLIGRQSESGLAQRPGQGWEEDRRRQFVVPYMRAASHTTAALIVRSLESLELAIGSPEAGGRDVRGEVRHGGVPDRAG